MTLEEKLKQDLVVAMKEKNKEKLDVIRMVKAAVDLQHINKKCDITDELVLDVLSKQIKMRNDSISEFSKAYRTDLVETYMPEQLTEEEVEKVIDEIFSTVKPESARDMGRVMKEATARLKGKTDMKMVSTKIKERLG